MQINYCLPIIKTKSTAVLDAIIDSKEYEYYEVWLDYVEDLNNGFIHHLLTAFKGKIIFVFRRQNLETPQMEMNLRLAMLSLFEKSDMMVDLDIVTQQEELKFIHEKKLKTKVIASYHNYQKTPTDEALISVISRMMEFEPYIYKIATKCVTPKDALRLLELLVSLKNDQKKYIILGMGEYGTITRVFGTLWGNELVFAPKKKEEASAPGQLIKEDMEKLLTVLTSK